MRCKGSDGTADHADVADKKPKDYLLIRLNPRNPRLNKLVAQLDVPVREIDKVSPALVLLRGERHMNERPPLRPLRFANESHVRFVRKTIPFARITRDAGANDVFPNRRSAAIARKDVIQIQFAAIENLSAILAGVLVAFENIVPRELHFLLRQAIE